MIPEANLKKHRGYNSFRKLFMVEVGKNLVCVTHHNATRKITEKETREAKIGHMTDLISQLSV